MDKSFVFPMKNLFWATMILLPSAVVGECTCEPEESERDENKAAALRYKLAAMASILAASGLGVCVPMAGKWVPALSPERSLFFVVKAFAAGVILATGFIHILPEAFERLNSPCLNETPWGNFPFAGFIAMLAAIGTLMVDTYATSYYTRRSTVKGEIELLLRDEEGAALVHTHGHAHGSSETELLRDVEGEVLVHSHATHGHAHRSVSSSETELLRHRVISQVLELGIIFHSVIIGIALGVSQNPKTIKPLIAALTFHQFFEGIGLGGCITQARFNLRAVAAMALFFSITTPSGIAIGIGISNIYSETSPTSLIVQGVFDSTAAGILIYMALVDLLAADFMSPKMQNNGKLQLGANASLLIGAGCMSLLAKWA